MNYFDVSGYLSNSFLKFFKAYQIGKGEAYKKRLQGASDALEYGCLFEDIIQEWHEKKRFPFVSEGKFKGISKRAKHFIEANHFYFMSKGKWQVEVFKELEFKVGEYAFKEKVKGKLDFIVEGMFIVDIKSTAATSQRQFSEAISHFGWDRQAVLYLLLTGEKRFIILGQCKTKNECFTYIIERDSVKFKQVLAEVTKDVYQFHILEDGEKEKVHSCFLNKKENNSEPEEG